MSTKIMSTISENNKRIAKNTLLLYFRMFFIMAVTLYTSRIILNELGVEDFGIYNVIGGMIAMFGFLNSAMASATQRYLIFELGKGDIQQLSKVFATSVVIHAFIGIIILILGETIGLWFVSNKLVIPTERMDAALWAYQFSIFTAIVMIISVPFNAIIISHERMSAFAYISVLEVSLKLAIVFVLGFFDFDKLKLYAMLMFSMQLLIQFVYRCYCRKHFDETRMKFILERKLFKDMLSFASWSLVGNCAAIFFTQGVNILLNLFFGPVVNAARGVAVQVQGAVNQFSISFQTALNPQITKSYAMQNFEYMHSLIYRSSKFTFFLLFIISLPVIIEAPMILGVWLKIVPEYTVVFVRIILCITIIDAIANPLMISASATGKVKLYQSVIGGVLLSILPISYIALKLGYPPVSVFLVHLAISIIAFIVRLFIIRSLIQFSVGNYIKKVLSKVFLVIILSLPIPLLLKSVLADNLINTIIVGICSMLIVMICAYIIGLTKVERMFVADRLRAIITKIK